MGLDQPAAEVFVSLATGGTLPNSGSVSAFGRATSVITDSQAWLVSLDRFGIVSDRAAIVEALSVVQNLAIPFSLDIEPPSADLRAQAIGLAREVQLPEAVWDRAVGELPAAHRMRVKLARALAFQPGLLLIEHPTATIDRGDVAPFAADLRRLFEARRLAAVVMTMDREFADALRARTLTLDPATGVLNEPRKGFRFWSR
jgi:ABC-type lipoprotein export system ATPase subunit